MSDMIRATGLVKHYGKVLALDGLDLSVPQGSILGLLGPNGAGKTTAIRILTTLLLADSGSAEVAGFDVVDEPGKVREVIGLSGQNAAVDEQLSGYENLDMVARLYHLGRMRSKTRARELLEVFDLTSAADRPVKTYSGGMRRRLDLAAALVASPKVLFLDEPTTGLDPQSRAQMWVTIEDLVKQGSTVLLTTQYMEEADHLADDIVVIDRGQVIARGQPNELKAKVGGERVQAVLTSSSDISSASSILAELGIGEVQVDESNRTLTAAIVGGTEVLRQVLQRFADSQIETIDIGLRRPTLDDVFLTLTGHHVPEGEMASGAAEGDGAITLDKTGGARSTD